MKVYKILFIIPMFILACTQDESHLGKYDRENMLIETKVNSCLDSLSYEIIDIVSLKLPESIPTIKQKQIKWVGNYIYILDSDYCKTLLVFDENGEYVRKLGEVGHAKNEYIEKPTSFMVDLKSGNVHIYERASVKILIFDKDGKIIDVRGLRPLVPGTIELLDNGNYLCCFEDEFNGNGDRLSVYNVKDKSQRSLIRYSDEGHLSFIGNPFFKDKNIVYNPFLSDSLIVFSSDTVKKVVKFHFDCKCNSSETIKKSMKTNSYMPLYNLKEGVQFIDNVEMTDSLIHISYAYNLVRCNYVKNLTNGKVYNGLQGTLFAGITPCSDFTIKDNKLIYFITEDDVDLVRTNIMSNPDNWEKSRKETPKKMLDIIEKKIPTPIILTIKLK